MVGLTGVLSQINFFSIGMMILFFGTLMLGRMEIVNAIKYKLLKRNGYTYFGFLTPSGRIEEAVLKIDKEIKWRGGTYLYNPKFSYKYDVAGNMFIENHPNAVNLSKIYASPELLNTSQDSKSLDAILKRVYNLGKLSVLSDGFKNKLAEIFPYLALAGIGIAIFLEYKTQGMVSALIRGG